MSGLSFLANPNFWRKTATVAATAVGAAKTAGAFSKKETAVSAVDTSVEEAQKTAEQKSLMETQEEDRKSAARRALLSTPTSGFGANTNLARSFLTSL